MKKNSLAYIAQSLNVSKTLVSMVLNNQGDRNGISQETQRKVREKAEELNYQPNQMARSLRTGRSNTIGLIITDISNPFYAKLCRVIEDEVSKHKYNLMICSSDEDPKKELELIAMLNQRQVDGLIIASTQENGDGFANLPEGHKPFVLIDRYFPGLKCNHVVVDNVEGSRRAIQALIEGGYERVALMNITPEHLSTVKDRSTGYFQALEVSGIPVDKALVKDIPFNDISESVHRAMDDLLQQKPAVDAVFFANNNLAVAGLKSLREKGISIPDDLAILSFDDPEIFRLHSPPISAVSQPIEAMGSRAATMLINAIESNGKAKIVEEVLNAELVIRDSSPVKV